MVVIPCQTYRMIISQILLMKMTWMDFYQRQGKHKWNVVEGLLRKKMFVRYDVYFLVVTVCCSRILVTGKVVGPNSDSEA